jgi:hypothetical protein
VKFTPFVNGYDLARVEAAGLRDAVTAVPVNGGCR